MPAMSAPSTPHARQLLSSRWVYRTLREVYLEDGHTVLKRFVHHPGRRDLRRVWVREDRALRRLAGLPVPHTYGYTVGRCEEGPEILLRKEFIPGKPLQVPTERDAADVGHLLGMIHQRAVVIGDPAMENFVRTQAGELYAIDFGRARTFLARTPYFYFYAGKDMARVFRTAILGRSDLWPVFRGAYFAQFRPLAAARALTCRSTRFWLWHWRHRPIRPAAEARKS
jgi:hypothetical protein